MDTECVICFDPLKGQALFTATCGHVFHYNCIRYNVNHGVNTKCPLCRTEIPQLISASNDLKDLNTQRSLLAQSVSLSTLLSQSTLPTTQSYSFNIMGDYEEDSLVELGPLINDINDMDNMDNEDDMDENDMNDMNENENENDMNENENKNENKNKVNDILGIKIVPEYNEISYETKVVDVLVKISAKKDVKRTPLDLVAIVDKSGSMRGEKMMLVRRILAFILTQLNEHDRLSIISFDKKVYGVFGLRRCRSEQNEYLMNNIMNSDYMDPCGGTDIKLGIERGFKLLQERNSSNPITSVLLLTDGIGTIPTDEELDDMLVGMGSIPSFSIHCFGIGSDHDARFLNKIAEKGQGSYVFIEQPHHISDSIALCLGSLLSISGQNISVNITTPDSVILQHVKTTYPHSFSDNEVIITIPNILADETKDIILTCKLPENKQLINLCSVSMNYYDNMNNLIHKSLNYEINICDQNTQQQQQYLEVDRERNRYNGVMALKQAIQYGESNNLTDARRTLINAIEKLQTSITFNDPVVRTVQNDLELCLQRFHTEELYDSIGYAYAEQQCRSHSIQRSLNLSTPSKYLTQSQSDIVNKCH